MEIGWPAGGANRQSKNPAVSISLHQSITHRRGCRKILRQPRGCRKRNRRVGGRIPSYLAGGWKRGTDIVRFRLSKKVQQRLGHFTLIWFVSSLRRPRQIWQGRFFIAVDQSFFLVYISIHARIGQKTDVRNKN